MKHRTTRVFVLLYVAAFTAVLAFAQTSEVKEKAPMYSYVGNWAIPRDKWGDMEKENANNQKVLQAALANGTLVGYGNDMTIIHQLEGETHDEWWSATSQAGLL